MSDERQYHYHYDRSERLKRGGHDPAARSKYGILRNNRSLLILLLDLLLIVIIYVLLALVFKPNPAKDTRFGYEFTLRAVEFEDRILCTVRATPVAEQSEYAGRVLTVSFVYSHLMEQDDGEAGASEGGTQGTQDSRSSSAKTAADGKKDSQGAEAAGDGAGAGARADERQGPVVRKGSSDLLPPTSESSRLFRAELDALKNRGSITAVISVGEERFTLRSEIQRE
jgi:hypothetical protein